MIRTPLGDAADVRIKDVHRLGDQSKL